MKAQNYLSYPESSGTETIELIEVNHEHHNDPVMGTGACTSAGCKCTAFNCDHPGSAGEYTVCTVSGCGHYYSAHNY